MISIPLAKRARADERDWALEYGKEKKNLLIGGCVK
jgi:hypothetical protein